MPNELTRPGPPTELARVQVNVLSKANPVPGLLRLARVVVQQTPEVSAVFTQAKEESQSAEWLRNRIAPELAKFFPGENVEEVATYLADEYLQIGDSILLVSSETGRALARITEEDMYQPAPVPRESGNMVVPERRLRPDLEGFIVQWVFDRNQEREVIEKILSRVPQTQLLRDEGDSRALLVTRAGRRLLTTQIQDALPGLLEASTGITRGFLGFFPLGKPETPSEYQRIPDLRVFATARHLLQDPSTRNLRQDVRGSVLASASTGWIREIASSLLREGVRIARVSTPLPLGEAVRGRETGFWIASPNAAHALQRLGVRTLPVQFSRDDVAVYLTEPAGLLEVDPNAYWCRSREVHDRWTVETEMTATLWVDWRKVTVLLMSGAFPTGISLEPL